MPIPSQNEILLPFLETLRDGQPRTRAQVLGKLAQRFQLTEADLNQTSGQQFTIVNRVAWCDTYFHKAGFVSKERHHKDSMQDVFRITQVGQMQINRHADRIDVGYLQSFYQGKVYRGAASGTAASDAELEFFERLADLPDPWVSFHSISWIGQGTRTVGEIDFLVAHPDHGVLVLEVKGGEIFIEREGNRNQWYSRSQSGAVNSIHDPCGQADRNRRELSEYLERNRQTRNHNYAIFPAVALPDSQVDGDIRMDCPSAIFIDHRHLDQLEQRLLAVFAYWKQHADQGNQIMDGKRAIDALVDVLVPSRRLTPRIGDVFERERRKIEQLTEQQFRVLRSLRAHRRAAIVGGAGTGKTMLAMEKAQQLANDGLRVLFLAFNRNIVEWVERSISNEQIVVATYHSFVNRAQHLAGNFRSRNMGWEQFIAASPDLLLDAAQVLRDTRPDQLFDAIIVDEAQDFDDAMWISIPDLLHDPQHGILYVFFDDNQRIYTQISNIPMDVPPYILVDNCRNTQRIHTTMMGYITTDTDSYCDGPEGRDVEVISTASKDNAQRELQRVLHRLVNEENVSPEEIVILTPKSEKNSIWRNDMPLGNFILTWNMNTEMNMAIRVCTIFSFKGLESSVVILSELDKARDEVVKQLIYVGLSRARHHCIVLGELPGYST